MKQKLKNKSGISLIALIITIIVMIILATVVLFSSTDVFDLTDDTKFGMEKGAIEKAVSIRFTNYCKNSINYPLIGDLIDISNLESDEIQYVDYIRVLDYSDLVQLGVNNVDLDSIYKVNYYTNSVVKVNE